MIRELDRQIARIARGDHLCLLYRDPSEVLPVAALFLEQGLERGEHAFYVADDHSVDRVTDALAAAGVDVEQERANGRLRFLSAREYCPLDRFDPEAMLARFRELGDEVAASGAPALRAAVEMTWALTVGAPLDLLVEYEAWGNEIFEHVSGASLCMYNRDRFPPRVLERVVRTHPIVVLGDQVAPNPFYEPPAVFYSHGDDAGRLEWMLEQMRRAREVELERAELIARGRSTRERERLIRALQIERERLRTALEKVPAAISILRGPEHMVESANAVCRRYAGGRELLGRAVRDAMPELAGQGVFEALDLVYRTARAFVGREAPVRLATADGGTEIRYFDFAFQPLHGADGEVSGILTHAVAVDDRVRARRAIEEASRAKSEFMATISHELRTPLNAVIGYAELLKTGVPETIPAKMHRFVDRIRLSARHQQEIVDEILTFSRLEAGQEQANPEPADLRELAEEIRAVVEPLAEARGLTFRLELADSPATIVTDPRKLRQILLNLLGNAIKFTEEGSVGLRIRRDGGAVVFEVEDTGIGIAPEVRPHLFEPFWQADQSSTRVVGGTGLGLTIVLRFAQMLDGDVEVESETGEGTRFVVKLPADTARPAVAARA